MLYRNFTIHIHTYVYVCMRCRYFGIMFFFTVHSNIKTKWYLPKSNNMIIKLNNTQIHKQPHTRIYIYIHTCTHVYTHKQKNNTHTHIYKCMCVFVCLHAYVCVCVCVCVGRWLFGCLSICVLYMALKSLVII